MDFIIVIIIIVIIDDHGVVKAERTTETDTHGVGTGRSLAPNGSALLNWSRKSFGDNCLYVQGMKVLMEKADPFIFPLY